MFNSLDLRLNVVQRVLLQFLLTLTSSECTLLVVLPGTFISAVLHLWSYCFTADVCQALCTSTYRILPEHPEIGGLWKILFQSSSIHSLIITSSHHAFG